MPKPHLLLARLALVVLVLIHPAARAAAPEQAAQLVRETLEQAVAELLSEQERIRSDPQRAYRLLADVLAPHVDFELMSRLVLARHWRSATPEQQQRFVAAFRGSLLRDYAAVLSAHVDQAVAAVAGGDQWLEVAPAREERADRVVVRTRLHLNQAPPVAVDYRLHARGGEWQVYDVMIEGISFVTNRRAELDALLRREDLDQLIARLVGHNTDAGKPQAGANSP